MDLLAALLGRPEGFDRNKPSRAHLTKSRQTGLGEAEICCLSNDFQKWILLTEERFYKELRFEVPQIIYFLTKADQFDGDF